MTYQIQVIRRSIVLSVLSLSSLPVFASEPVPVHVLNFVRAETDQYFARYAAQGGLGQFVHIREPVAIDQQDVIRMNRDTLYSLAVFDLNKPVTIIKPDPDGRFQSMLVIDQDHYVVDIEHDAGTFTYEQDSVGTRYLFVIFRTFMDPEDKADIAAANTLQDKVKVQQASRGTLELPDWDQVSLERTRNKLLALAMDAPGESSNVFGSRKEVDPIKHLFGTAVGWGGNPESAAMYEGVFPEQNDGRIPHTLTVSDVPVDGFWSLTVYNGDGYMVKNDADAYSVNNVTADKNPDGRVTVHFGGCDGNKVNCLPIMQGWNYTIRMYQPRAEIINGSWTFPRAKPIR